MKPWTDVVRRRRTVLHAIAAAGMFALVGALAPAAAQEEAGGTPRETVETLHRALVAAAREASVDARYRALERVVTATHDLPYIAQFALRRQWPALSEAEREEFSAAFQRLSVMTYASRFATVTEQTFAITGTADAAAGRAGVTATVARANGEPVTLEYLLHEADGRWRIINIVADGVSDLALKRSEYQAALASGTLHTLIADLNAQTDSLAQSAAR